MFNRKYIFKGSIFHCYVRLPECTFSSGGQKKHTTIICLYYTIIHMYYAVVRSSTLYLLRRPKIEGLCEMLHQLKLICTWKDESIHSGRCPSDCQSWSVQHEQSVRKMCPIGWPIRTCIIPNDESQQDVHSKHVVPRTHYFDGCISTPSW